MRESDENSFRPSKLGFNVFHMIKRSEWKKIRKDKNLIFSIPNNKKGEKDSEYSIRKIVEATSNNKTDFMYSVILSENEEKMLPDYIKKGLLWLAAGGCGCCGED